MKTMVVGGALVALALSACSGSAGGAPSQPSITPPLGPLGLSARPSASPPAGLLSRSDAIRIAERSEGAASNVRLVAALLRQWGEVRYAYGLQASHPAIITAPGLSPSPYPTPVAGTWVWVVYFVEDQTVHLSATDVRHFGNVPSLDVLDAGTGAFFAGQSGQWFDVPPSEGK